MARIFGTAVAVALAASVTACGSKSSSSGHSTAGIVGGIQVKAGDPVAASTVMIVRLQRGGQLSYMCSGAIVATDLVLTVAHCMFSDEDWPLTDDHTFVFFGSYDEQRGNRAKLTGKLGGMAIHPYAKVEMGKVTKFDIAVLKLRSPLPKGFAPATMLSASEDLSYGQQVIVAGFGQTTIAPSSRNRLFKYEKTEVRALQPNGLVEIRAPARAGPYEGDSGGPAFVMDEDGLKLWGIYSTYWTDDSGMVGRADVEDIRYYSRWINRAAANLGSGFRIR